MSQRYDVKSFSHRIAVDRVKAIAILLVMWLHYFGQPMQWHSSWVGGDSFLEYWAPFSSMKLVRFVAGFGYLGVNLFVIASGFGLQSSALQKPQSVSYLGFLQRRLRRLLPLAILASGIVWLFKAVWLSDPPDSSVMVNSLPFLAGANLFSDETFYPPINGELWFLGLIIQLYMLFPILQWLLKRIGTKRFLFILFMISACFRLCCVLWLRHYVSYAAYGWCVGRLFEFGFGMYLANAASEGSPLSRFWALGLCLFWGYFWWWSYPFADILLGVGLFSLIWNGLKNLTGTSIFQYMSARSYSLFLIHHPVIWMFNNLGIRNAWTVRGAIGFALFLYIAIGLASILDAIAINRRRYFLAVGCVGLGILMCVVQIEFGHNTPDQTYAINRILQSGGVVNEEESFGFGQVHEIRLEGRRFSDIDAELLMQFPGLTRISLYGSQVTDATVMRLTDLPHLSELGLQGTNITTTSLDHLARMKSLRYVWLTAGNSVTDNAVQRLKARRPDLNVFVN